MLEKPRVDFLSSGSSPVPRTGGGLRVILRHWAFVNSPRRTAASSAPPARGCGCGRAGRRCAPATDHVSHMSHLNGPGIRCARLRATNPLHRPWLVAASGADCALAASTVLRRRRQCRRGGRSRRFPPYIHSQSPDCTLDTAGMTADSVSTGDIPRTPTITGGLTGADGLATPAQEHIVDRGTPAPHENFRVRRANCAPPVAGKSCAELTEISCVPTNPVSSYRIRTWSGCAHAVPVAHRRSSPDATPLPREC